MMNHDNPVAREVNVELEAIGAGRQSAIERLTVFSGPILAPAAMQTPGGAKNGSPDAPRDLAG
jgi:hypothetical protein